jgi:hypothetical protein
MSDSLGMGAQELSRQLEDRLEAARRAKGLAQVPAVRRLRNSVRVLLALGMVGLLFMLLMGAAVRSVRTLVGAQRGGRARGNSRQGRQRGTGPERSDPPQHHRSGHQGIRKAGVQWREDRCDCCANLDDTAGYPTAIIQQIWSEVEAENPKPSFAVTTGDYMFAATTGTDNPSSLNDGIDRWSC